MADAAYVDEIGVIQRTLGTDAEGAGFMLLAARLALRGGAPAATAEEQRRAVAAEVAA